MPLQPRRLAVALAAIVGLLVALYVIVLATAGVRAGYSWHDMDWDGDGRTDLREVLRAADIGRRSAVQAGRRCTEYFSLKDGLPIRVVCRSGPS